MRILHITNNYTPYNGGVVHAIDSLTSSQKKTSTLCLITFDFKSDHPLNDPSFVHRLWSPFHFSYKGNSMVVPYHMTEQLAQIVINFKPTIIHAHHPFLLGSAAQKIAACFRCPFVFTHHTWYSQYMHYSPFQSRIISSLIQNKVSSFCKKVDGIIAPSKTVFDFLRTTVQQKNLALIPSPIADRFFEKISSKTPCKGRKIRLLSLSRFVHEKNLSALFEVCQALKSEYELVIAGFGYLEYELKETAYQKYKFSPYTVKFISNPSENTVDELYNWADLFLFTSQSDTQGLVLAEALARAAPVIHLKTPGQLDIIKDGYNGFCAENPQEMALKIEAVHRNQDLLNLLIQNGVKTAQAYHKRTISSQIMKFYRTCLNSFDKVNAKDQAV